MGPETKSQNEPIECTRDRYMVALDRLVNKIRGGRKSSCCEYEWKSHLSVEKIDFLIIRADLGISCSVRPSGFPWYDKGQKIHYNI
jgi:hypothetical protein